MGKCEKCGDAGKVVENVKGDEVVKPCPICSKRVVEVGPEVFGAPVVLWPGHDPKVSRVTDYVRHLPAIVNEGVGLFITGAVNSGKTSTALYIMDAMAKVEPAAHLRYLRMRELLSRLAEDWRGIQRAIDEARALDLLIIDDAFDSTRGWMDNDARKTALDEYLRAYVEDGNALIVASSLDMDEVANVWGPGRAGLLEKRLVEVQLKKDFAAAAQREVGRRLKR